MAKTWILVAHEAGARVFENRGPGKGLELVETIDHPEGQLRDRDIDADRPGRSFRKDSGDPRRAAMSRSEGPHDRAVADFARSLADKLQHARVTNRYERLVLVASPSLLGLVRSALDGPTAQAVVGAVDKNLARSKESELIERLGGVIAV
jgi:protein required for attachment to host cells